MTKGREFRSGCSKARSSVCQPEIESLVSMPIGDSQHGLQVRVVQMLAGAALLIMWQVSVVEDF